MFAAGPEFPEILAQAGESDWPSSVAAGSMLFNNGLMPDTMASSRLNGMDIGYAGLDSGGKEELPHVRQFLKSESKFQSFVQVSWQAWSPLQGEIMFNQAINTAD